MNLRMPLLREPGLYRLSLARPPGAPHGPPSGLHMTCCRDARLSARDGSMTNRQESRGHKSVLRTVFRFAVRHWARRKGLAAALCASMSLATLTEIFVPVFAGRLIDALALGGAAGRRRRSPPSWRSSGWALAMVVLRHLAWWAVVPFTLSIMRAARVRGVPPGPAAVDRLARQQLRGLAGAQGDARHVGVRRARRRRAAGAAALAGRAVRHGAAARPRTGRCWAR